MAEARRTFGPVVLLGLASAGLAAVSASKTWVTAHQAGTDAGSSMAMAFGEYGTSPLAAALALVVLAAWGVILVTRGRFRRLVAALSVMAALGFSVTTALAPSQLGGALEDQLAAANAKADDGALAVTPWWWAALGACVLMLATTALALRWVPTWPEMGTRYDAPAGAPQADDAPPETNIDIWKALDDGRDPTA